MGTTENIKVKKRKRHEEERKCGGEARYLLIEMIPTGRRRLLCEIKSAAWVGGKAINDLFCFES